METRTSLEYLDGYRGFLANTVIIAHIGKKVGLEDFGSLFEPFLILTSRHIGVYGFFVLSAFLLTYRLMIDFAQADSFTTCLKKLAKYSIRRFFRIYLVFLIFWTLLSFGPAIFRGYYEVKKYANYTDGLVLKSVGQNYLWTIPPEIKYYFFIPIISFISAKTGKYWIAVWSLSFVIMLYVEIFNPFSFPSGTYSFSEGLKPRFTVFFAGSQLAILFFYLEKMPCVREYASQKTVKNILRISLDTLFFAQYLLIYLYIKYDRWSSVALSFKHSYISAKYQATLIVILLYVDDKSFITKMLKSDYFRMCGRYSFGIYLLHPTVVQASRVSSKFSKHVLPEPIYKFMYEYTLTRLFIIIGLVCLVGSVWFHVIENNLMKMANKLSKWIEQGNHR
jgi:peptidoglycan/LPS O-acetylase OafA/YrhL